MRRLVMAVVLVLTLGLAACTEDSGEAPSETEAQAASATTTATAQQTAVATPTSTPTPTETPTPEPTSAPGQSRANPLRIGEPATVGGWTIIVNSVVPDATSEVLAENSFNEPPTEGRQFFIANVSATYEGDEEPANIFVDLGFQTVGPSAVAYRDFEDSCGVIPEELDTFVDVFRGGTVEGNLCWAVTGEDAGALLLMVEESFTFNSSPVWLSLIP